MKQQRFSLWYINKNFPLIDDLQKNYIWVVFLISQFLDVFSKFAVLFSVMAYDMSFLKMNIINIFSLSNKFVFFFEQKILRKSIKMKCVIFSIFEHLIISSPNLITGFIPVFTFAASLYWLFIWINRKIYWICNKRNSKWYHRQKKNSGIDQYPMKRMVHLSLMN